MGRSFLSCAPPSRSLARSARRDLATNSGSSSSAIRIVGSESIPALIHLCSKNSSNPLAPPVHQLDGCLNVQKERPRPQESKMGKLQGKVAVVTGASKGIGAGIAKALAA